MDFDVEAQSKIVLDSQFIFPAGAKTRNFPNYQTRFITTHKNACRVAKFSPDGKRSFIAGCNNTGRFVATGSTDTSIKMLDVEKMKTYSQVSILNKETHFPRD